MRKKLNERASRLSTTDNERSWNAGSGGPRQGRPFRFHTPSAPQYITLFVTMLCFNALLMWHNCDQEVLIEGVMQETLPHPDNFLI